MEAERRKKNPGSVKSKEPPPQSVSTIFVKIFDTFRNLKKFIILGK